MSHEKPEIDFPDFDPPADLEVTDLVEGEGAEAKPLLAGGLVRVNGDVETRRGRQLAKGDVVSVAERSARVS